MIAVTFQRVGYHNYPAAPSDVAYLRDLHRHLFKFKVSIEVFAADREIEFHQFLNWLESLYDGQLSLNNASCEMVSDALAATIESQYPGRQLTIEVWEDGECGSVTDYVSVAEDGECGAIVSKG